MKKSNIQKLYEKAQRAFEKQAQELEQARQTMLDFGKLLDE
jgi:hypothetical protein